MSKAKIPDICDHLCEMFQQLAPLHPTLPKGRKKPSEKDIKLASERGVQQFLELARAERLKHQLGIIGRARVALGLQQRLLQTGYPAALIKQVLFAMLASAFVGDSK